MGRNAKGVVGLALAVVVGPAGAALGQNCPMTSSAGGTLTMGGISQAAGTAAAADFNVDGWVDLVTAATGTCQVFYGNGPGTFNPPQELMGITVSALVVADMNLDGRPDIISLSGSALRVSINQAGVGIGFLAPQLYGLGAPAVGLAVGDFTQDGRPDIAIGRETGAWVYRGVAGGTFTSATTLNIGQPSNFVAGVAAIDYTHDGRPDLALVSQGPTGAVLFYAASGAVGTVTLTAGPSFAFQSGSVMVVMDLNADGLPDLVAGQAQNGQPPVMSLTATAAGGFTSSLSLPNNLSTALALATGDFDNDGRSDLLLHGDQSTLLLPGSGIVATLNNVSRGALVVADFNKDGRLDWGGTRAGGNQLDLFFNTTPMITQQPVSITVGQGQACAFSVAGVNLTRYQWRRNGAPIGIGGVWAAYSGATTATLTLVTTTAADSGAVFDCVVSEGCGSQTSRSAALIVTSPCGSSDFNGDGDYGTDADIQSFFSVLGGAGCVY